MGRAGRSTRGRERRAANLLDAEVAEQRDDSANVHQRVHGAELVKLHLLCGDTVHRALGLGQALERRDGAGAHLLVQVGVLQEPADRVPAPLVRLVAGADVDVERADCVALLPRDHDLDSVQAEPAGERAQDGLVGAGIEEGCEEHVAREPADAVQVGEPRHGPACAARAIRAAIVPAPKPSSMPTTARPAAQEQSMAFSAVRPPSAEP